MKVICCECGKMIRPGADPKDQRVSHGYCRPCKERILAEMDAWVDQMERADAAVSIRSGASTLTPTGRRAPV
jgi:hypothetical protein